MNRRVHQTSMILAYDEIEDLIPQTYDKIRQFNQDYPQYNANGFVMHVSVSKMDENRSVLVLTVHDPDGFSWRPVVYWLLFLAWIFLMWHVIPG